MGPPGRLLLAAVLLAACEVEAGNQKATIAACGDLCAAQQGAPGCTVSAEACGTRCVDDTVALDERCLLVAQRYYACAAEVAWSCPNRPDLPETEDARCAPEQHAWLVCAVTGMPPP
jgi:hypothetical protein